MLILMSLCLFVAMSPQTVTGLMAHVLDKIVGSVAGHSFTQLEFTGPPLSIVGRINTGTLVAIVIGTIGFLFWSRLKTTDRQPTWCCGYVKPTVRMQYTGRSFTEMLSSRLVPRFLRLRISNQSPQGLFPKPSNFASETNDPIGEKIYEPFFQRCTNWLTRLRFLQKGQVHVYLLYIAITVVAALSWASVRRLWDVP